MAEDKREGDSDDEFDYMRDFTFDDWEYCWSKNKADWNKSFVDPVFQKFFPIAVQKLGLADKELRVLLPLCGKTPDLIWCANLGHSVVGVEYVEQGVREFFEENKFEHETTVHGELKHHQCLKKHLKLSMWQGDFFQCTSDLVGQFDLAWDHGSFTAINTGDRERYVEVVVSLLKPGGAVIMSSFAFGDEEPIDIPAAFGNFCTVELLETMDSLYGKDHPELAKEQGCHDMKVQRSIHLIKKKSS